MAIRIVRLGTPRLPGEGLRLGTVRRPPRGIAKARWAEIDFFDVCALLAALSRRSDFSVGCYCADESRCHRTLLRELFEAAGAGIA